MRPLTLALAFFLGTLAFSGCIIAIGPGATDGTHTSWGWGGKRGSGVAATQARTVPEFHAIRIEGACDVQVAVGREQQVSVTTDDNLIDDLTTEVHDGVLVIATRPGVSASYRVGPQATIGVKALDSLAIEGSGDAHVQGVDCEKFSASISGSGDLSISGKAVRVAISIEGSGDADLSGLDAQDASVQIEGSGDVRVRCSANLSAAVAGSGDVEYIGSPHTSISVSGSGDVHPVR